MNEAAWLPDTAGTELPPRSRITTTTLRLPFWFPAKTTVNATFSGAGGSENAGCAESHQAAEIGKWWQIVKAANIKAE